MTFFLALWSLVVYDTLFLIITAISTMTKYMAVCHALEATLVCSSNDSASDAAATIRDSAV